MSIPKMAPLEYPGWLKPTNAQVESELRAQIVVYRDTLKLAAFRFRTMGSDTAASDIESVLKETP